MKKIALILMTAFLLAGCTAPLFSSPYYTPGYGEYAPPPENTYAPPPADTYAQPWMGPGTPWVYYNGDWFLNGVLYYYFGRLYGWAPYYAYPSIYIVRPGEWYGHRWWAWYHRHPHYWRFFVGHYPYWRGHRVGHRYGLGFYERYNRGQGRGWHGGFDRRWGRDGHRQSWHDPAQHRQMRWGQQFRSHHWQTKNYERRRMQQRPQTKHGGQGSQKDKQHQSGQQ